MKPLYHPNDKFGNLVRKILQKPSRMTPNVTLTLNVFKNNPQSIYLLENVKLHKIYRVFAEDVPRDKIITVSSL